MHRERVFSFNTKVFFKGLGVTRTIGIEIWTAIRLVASQRKEVSAAAAKGAYTG